MQELCSNVLKKIITAVGKKGLIQWVSEQSETGGRSCREVRFDSVSGGPPGLAPAGDTGTAGSLFWKRCRRERVNSFQIPVKGRSMLDRK